MKKIILLSLGLLLSLSAQISYAQGGSSSRKTSTYQGNNNTASGELLTTIGTTTAQGIYITYAAIGTLADAHVKGAYEKSTTLALLGEYIALTEAVSKQLKKLVSAKTLNVEDTQFVNGVMETYIYLEAEANAFKNYLDKDNNSYLSDFERNRVKAWEKIKKLLNITE